MKRFLPLLLLLWFACEDDGSTTDTIYGTWELVERNMAKEDPPYWSPFQQYYYSYRYLEITKGKIKSISHHHNEPCESCIDAVHENAPCKIVQEGCDYTMTNTSAYFEVAEGVFGYYLQENGDLIFITEAGVYLHKFTRVELPDFPDDMCNVSENTNCD